jgi:pyruvate formate lyase activating enzyme
MNDQRRSTLSLAGFQPLTTVEWEGRLAAVLFFQGCPWRCRYCHNPRLVAAKSSDLMPWEEALAFLEGRRGLLDAVVFSGGEPTHQPALPEALREVRLLGFDLALHTNGHDPDTLTNLLATGDVSYVAMDLKAPFGKYERVTRKAGSGRRAEKSAKAIISSGVEHEFRTTYHSELLSADDIRSIAQGLRRLGGEAYYLQKYRGEGCVDMRLLLSPSEELPEALVSELGRLFPRFAVRG